MNEILIIPRHLVFVRFVDIPSLDESEIGKMAVFHAIKAVPYPKEEMIISYRNLGSYTEGFTSIMLVIAKRQTVEAMMRERNFNVENVRLHSELLYLFLLKKEMLNPEKVELVIDIGKDESELMVISNARILFSRGFKNSDRFLEDIRQSALDYQRDKKNPAIENVLAAYASYIDMQDIKPPIIGHFRIPVDFFEYGEDLAAIGLPAEIDLLPRELASRKINSQKKRERFITYSLIGITMLLFFSFLYLKIHEKERLLKILSLKIDKIQSMTSGLDGFIEKTDITKKHLEKGRFIADVMKRSYNLISGDIVLLGLNYDGRTALSYKGTAKKMSVILRFVKRLEGLRYFDKAEVKYAAKKKVKGEEIIDFNIRCLLKQ